MKKQIGFTLIELMISVAIVSILAALALPIYHKYTNKASVVACLSEAKSYANYIFYTLNEQNEDISPIAPIVSACESITDASSWNETTTNLIIEAKSKKSTTVNIKCDLSKGANCVIVP